MVLARRASGYGGVVAVRHTINNQPHIVIYGHLDPASLPPVGKQLSAGEVIGNLGKGFSNETDGERKHLHLAILGGDKIDLRGYVQSKAELSRWIDPVSLF